jgi:hypothetical protein
LFQIILITVEGAQIINIEGAESCQYRGRFKQFLGSSVMETSFFIIK